jgi:glutamyl-tRNA reductase
VAKRVRTETGVGRSAVSMSFAAVELSRKILGSLQGRTVLLVGAGKMSALAARHLVSAGCREVVVINRSPDRARELAEEIGGVARAWEELARQLAEADVVLCSTAAPTPVITVELALAARKARKHRPLFFVDLAVPRDVEPKVASLDGMYVYDVDDLAAVVEENRQARQEEAGKAEAIVAAEAEAFLAAATSEAGPVLRELRRQAEAIARAEVERTLARGHFDDAQRKSVEAMARAIVNKILHEPTARIRSAPQEEQGPILSAAVELFGIGDGPAPKANEAVAAPPTPKKEIKPQPSPVGPPIVASDR